MTHQPTECGHVALSMAQSDTYGATCHAGHSPIRPWRTPSWRRYSATCARRSWHQRSSSPVGCSIACLSNGQIQRRRRATRGADRWNLRLADPSVILPPDALTFPVVGPRMHLAKPGQHHSQGSPVNADLVRARHEWKLPNYPTERRVILDDDLP